MNRLFDVDHFLPYMRFAADFYY
ncbi:MAG: hypothetical protein KAS04_04735 [Candidatus Aenigmarchaeota archaeon]|nr:hypothetical protein [Candidatus Aenigmarchaeota archaeon]